MSKYKLCRGFKDLLPIDYKKYEFLKNSIEEVSDVYGYKMVRTSCIEESSLFTSSFKEDISKRLFIIDNKFTNDVSLNYDNSISTLRSVVENKLYVDKSLPLKLMYLNEVYYYDKVNPGCASKSEFGFECIGDKSVYLDVENILLNIKILSFLGLNNYNLRVKNIREDNDYYLTFKQTLTNLGVDFVEDNKVKGKEYHTGISYEIDVDDTSSVISGGRYDNLISVIGGVSVGCNGSHIDFSKLIDVMDSNELFPSFKEETDFYIIPVGEKTFKYALYVSELLRDMGAIVEIHYKEYDLKRLDDLLERVDVTYALVIDEKDVNKETIKVRNSISKSESVVKLKDFIKDLEELEKHHHEEE